MKIDRRQFIQIGAMAAVAGSGCGPSPQSAAPLLKPTTTGGPSLEIDFQGLYLVEQKSATMIVHLIDGPVVGLPPHIAQMKALASTIDQTKTKKPDPAHIIPAGANDDYWLWDLKGVGVDGPPASSGKPDLTWDQSSSEDGLEMPTSDPGWHSFARIPSLRVLCGATKITNAKAFASSVTLSHGHLGVLKPTDQIGPKAVWVFVNPTSGSQLMRRALSNQLSYVCPTNGGELTVQVGGQPVVFKAGAAQAWVTNMPPAPGACGTPCLPTMHHFSAFAQIVDAKFTPTISVAAAITPDPGHEAGADYCPGSFI